MECEDEKTVSNLMAVYRSHKRALAVHAEYSHNLPKALERLSDLKNNDAVCNRIITVNHSLHADLEIGRAHV